MEIDFIISENDVCEVGKTTYRITDINEIKHKITLRSVNQERTMTWSEFESVMNNSGKVQIHRDLIDGA